MANVLLLGCTSAVAACVARRMAEQGDKLFLVGRNTEKLGALKAELAGAVMGYSQLDFNHTQRAAEVTKEAFKAMGTVDTVLIAHGDIGDQLLSEEDFEHAQSIINTNYLSAVSLLIPVAKALKQQGHGKIAVLVSVAGDRGRPRNFTYGSAKGALNIYLQGLRSVLYEFGVEVYSFKLGPVDSPMTVDHEKNFSFTSVEKAADLILKGLAGRRYTRYVPGFWFWVMLVVRWLPEPVFQRLGFLSDR